MEALQAFYDAVSARAADAVAALDGRPFAGLDAAETRLMQLVLMLAHVAIAVEVHGAPRAPFTPFPHDVKITCGPAFLG